jgi:hypothetical protein
MITTSTAAAATTATITAAATTNNNVDLFGISDEVFVLIAHCLSPCEVYNLYLTSRRFHQPTTLPSSPLFSQRGGNATDALISTRLLRTSLFGNLQCVLERSTKPAIISSIQFKSNHF